VDAEVEQGRGFILSPRKYGRSWCVGADRACPICAWQCQRWGKLSLEQARGKCLVRLPSVLFLLERKRTKKFKRDRSGTIIQLGVSSDELAFGRAFISKVLRTETPLRAITRFLEALNFSI
jgi:hypothetical protein